MRCEKHPYELGDGVCASCLRERLLALQTASRDGRSPGISHNPSHPPPLPPLAFPSCLRPRRLRRFFSTPQMGPTWNASYSFCKKKNSRVISIFSSLFGTPKSDVTRSPRSSSWIPGLFAKRSRPPKPEPLQEREMSPGQFDDDEDDDCSSEWSPVWRRPEPTPVRNFPQSRRGRGVSGFAVCLSPLVRPSSKPAAGLGITGDRRGGLSGARKHRRHVPVGEASLVPGRSIQEVGGLRPG